MMNTIEKWLDGDIGCNPKTKGQIRTETRKNKKITNRGYFKWDRIVEGGKKYFGFLSHKGFVPLNKE